MKKMFDTRAKLVEQIEDLAELLELAPTEVYNRALAIGLVKLHKSLDSSIEENDILNLEDDKAGDSTDNDIHDDDCEYDDSEYESDFDETDDDYEDDE